MTTWQRITVSPIAGALGAEIGGVDIAAGVDDETIAEIRRALLEHLVIFFRGQSLNDATLKQFAANYGDFFRHPYFIPEGDPDIVVIRRAPGDKRIVGEGWHSDTPAVAAPHHGGAHERAGRHRRLGPHPRRRAARSAARHRHLRAAGRGLSGDLARRGERPGWSPRYPEPAPRPSRIDLRGATDRRPVSCSFSAWHQVVQQLPMPLRGTT